MISSCPRARHWPVRRRCSSARPGVLEVQSRPGKTFRVFELLAKLGGKDPGALLSVTAQPGKESLEQQISGLDATAAKAK